MLGGYYMIEAASYDQALERSRDCPHLEYGGTSSSGRWIRFSGGSGAAVSERRAVGELVDHLFRKQARRMVGHLTRAFGPEHLSLAEEVVQDALVKALQQWPFHGIPDNPDGWLLKVARNGALDVLRPDTVLRGKEAEIRRTLDRSFGVDEPLRRRSSSSTFSSTRDTAPTRARASCASISARRRFDSADWSLPFRRRARPASTPWWR